MVFETGTYWGYSTAYLAAAARDNGIGKVHTFDIDSNAGKHFPAELCSHAEFYFGKPSSESMPPVLDRCVPQLFFQDSRRDYEGVVRRTGIGRATSGSRAVILFYDFVSPEVRNAAHDMLKDNFLVRVLASDDPQHIGLAVKAG